MPVSSARVCPILIDRAAELAVLDAMLAETSSGRGSFCVLLGEPGAGKSRLAQELSTRAIAKGFQTIEGGCLDRDRDFPFAPFVDALRQCLMTSQASLQPSLWRGLAIILPELRDQLDFTDDSPALAPEQEKRQLFESIVTFLAARSAVQPLLLVMEDLHWADPTSLELLEIVPRRWARSRVAMVATARRDESNTDLQDWLAWLRRTRAITEISVELLGEPAVGRMVNALLGREVTVALTSAVHIRTEGNPFLI